jgi:hypothetical protein
MSVAYPACTNAFLRCPELEFLSRMQDYKDRETNPFSSICKRHDLMTNSTPSNPYTALYAASPTESY